MMRGMYDISVSEISQNKMLDYITKEHWGYSCETNNLELLQRTLFIWTIIGRNQ